MIGLKDYLIDESLNGDMGMFRALAQKYVECIGEDNIKSVVKSAENDINDVISKLWSLDIPFVTKGQFVGRVLETCIARHLTDLNGFRFQQGVENSSDKDFECKAIPGNVKDDFEGFSDINKFNNPHNFGIELKCFQGSSPVGNKSYAADDDNGLKGDKKSFYLLIGYTPIKASSKTGESLLQRISIRSIRVVYLLHSDWQAAAKGNSASLKAGTSEKMITIM